MNHEIGLLLNHSESWKVYEIIFISFCWGYFGYCLGFRAGKRGGEKK